MRLTIEEHPQAVKRYGHIRPARAASTNACGAACPGEIGRTCTRPKGHRGPHVAHGWFRRILAVWDTSSWPRTREAPTSGPEAPARRGVPKRPVGLPWSSARGSPEAVRDLVVRTLSSWDQIAFIVLFIIMVKFAIDVLLSLG